MCKVSGTLLQAGDERKDQESNEILRTKNDIRHPLLAIFHVFDRRRKEPIRSMLKTK